MGSKRAEAKQAEVLTATLRRRQRLSPSFARLTLAGGGLERFEQRGFDQWFRLFMPRGGQEHLRLPSGNHDHLWYQQYLATPDAQRPCMRYVTVRDHRPDGEGGPEIDVDVVVHGEPGQPATGPLSTWAQTAEPGQRLGLLDQGLIFRPELAAAGVLLIGDETAMPAVAGILRSLPPEAKGQAFIEVPHQDDVQALKAPAGVEVRWLPRQDAEALPGRLALATVLGSLPAGEHPYVYAAGEAGMATALNHALRQELDWPKDRISAVTYWRYVSDTPA